MLRRAGWGGLGGLITGLLLWRSDFLAHDAERMALPPARALSAEPLADAPPDARALPLPSGGPTRISCDEALRVSAFLERELSTPAIAPLPRELAELWGSMLDPHGLWSASPDSPVERELATAAEAMITALHGGASRCTACRARA